MEGPLPCAFGIEQVMAHSSAALLSASSYSGDLAVSLSLSPSALAGGWALGSALQQGESGRLPFLVTDSLLRGRTPLF